MNRGNSSKRSNYRLKQLIEIATEDLWVFSGRGLKPLVEDVEATGQPIERIKIVATLCFLPLGSPFCCGEPGCHMRLSSESMDRLGDRFARDMGLRQPIEVIFEEVLAAVTDGVEFDIHIPFPPAGDVNARDLLGRTALIRAAQRRHDDQFEQLMELGADLRARDNAGKTALDYLHRNHWLRALYDVPDSTL